MEWDESRRPLRFFTSFFASAAPKVRKMLQKWFE
jgi:hypothetical protein